MALVNDDVAQVREDAGKLTMYRKYAHVEHVGVGDEQLCTVSHLATDRLGRRANHYAEKSVYIMSASSRQSAFRSQMNGAVLRQSQSCSPLRVATFGTAVHK